MRVRESIGLLGRLLAHDDRAFSYLIGRRHARLDSLMRHVTRLGDPPVVIGLAVVLLLVPNALARAAGLRAAIALTVSHLLVQVLKRTISRPRPHLPVGVVSLIQAPDRFSFPSGHSAAALAVALSVATYLSGLLALPVVGLGLLVGVSRSYLGVHYPGDVLAGWLLALSGVLVAVI
jgi:undecaprenyl-diphosphatase